METAFLWLIWSGVVLIVTVTVSTMVALYWAWAER